MRLAKLLNSGKRLPHRLAHAARVAIDILYWTVTWQLAAGLRRRRHARLLRRSGLFDRAHYLAQCPGDREAPEDPFTHYLTRGAARGLDPSPLFDTSAYAARNGAGGENPLVHFILSGGGARAHAHARAALPPRGNDAADPTQLHPFRTPPAGPGWRAVLVVQGRAPAGDAALARTLALVGGLRDLGHPVALATASADAPPGTAEALRRVGVPVHRGAAAALAHLVAEGHRYRWVLLSDVDEAFRMLGPLRAYAPQATVVYEPASLRPARPARDGEGDPAEPRCLGPAEKVAVSCSDLVLAGSARERDALLAEVPQARVVVVAAGPSRSRLEALLAAPAAPSARPEPASVEAGSAA